MVNFKRLADKAKDVVEKRGGTDALKEDAQELKDIAKGKGSLKEKAKAAADALKEPGETPDADRPASAPRQTRAPEGGTPRQAK